MSYQINFNYTLKYELKRIMMERIAASVQSLENDGDKDEVVHKVRKNMKKIRAILRLYRYSLGQEIYHDLNIHFRDIGRKLSDLRDSKVNCNTFISLMDQYHINPEEKPYSDLHRKLIDNYNESWKAHGDNLELFPEMGSRLAEGINRTENIPVKQVEPEELFKGLKKVYKKGYRAKNKTLEKPENNRLHEWRKRGKYLWYHIRLLQSCWPEMLTRFAKIIHKLSDDLGKDHDLAVLNSALQSMITHPETKGEITKLILESRSLLQKKATERGVLIYAERPSGFTNRIDTYCRYKPSTPKTGI